MHYDSIIITEVVPAYQYLSESSMYGYEKNYDKYGEMYHSECRVEPLLRLAGGNEQVSSLINSDLTEVSNATRSRVSEVKQ